MKCLLDTSIWLWSLTTWERCNEKARDLLASGEDEFYLSAASSWEIVIKTALGRLELPEPAARYIPRRMATQGIRPLSITHTHALAVSDLPLHHGDPFDRLLIAQARAEEMVILTADHAFELYEVEIFWCGR
jgi:PIN domain nuclease of toxin-antitoxin system